MIMLYEFKIFISPLMCNVYRLYYVGINFIYMYSYPDELRVSSITIGVYHILVFLGTIYVIDNIFK